MAQETIRNTTLEKELDLSEELLSKIHKYFGEPPLSISGNFKFQERNRVKEVTHNFLQRGFVFVENQINYKATQQKIARQYEEILGCELIREFVDHENKIAGFSWRQR